MKRLFVTLCALLSVAACSDDSSSSADPPSPAPTVSSSAAEASPTADPETPEEFVRRWVEVDREMQNSGDTTEFRSISTGCSPCDGLADQIEHIYEAGGYVKTEGLQILRLKASQKDSNNEVVIHLWVDSKPTELVESAGAKVQHLPGGKLQYLVTIRKTESSWNTVLLEGVAQ